MQLRILATLLLLVSGPLTAETHQCPSHKHVLTTHTLGEGPVSHWAWLDGHQLISELEDKLWVIYKVTCTSEGFIITVHPTLGDTSEHEIFELIVDESGDYQFF